MTDPHRYLDERDFPYDPTLTKADIASLSGLEKLRAFEDREFAQMAYNVHKQNNQVFHARLERQHRPVSYATEEQE